jgi:hypothetical protein
VNARVRGAKRPQGEAGAHVGRARSARAKAGGRARAWGDAAAG